MLATLFLLSSPFLGETYAEQKYGSRDIVDDCKIRNGGHDGSNQYGNKISSTGGPAKVKVFVIEGSGNATQYDVDCQQIDTNNAQDPAIGSIRFFGESGIADNYTNIGDQHTYRQFNYENDRTAGNLDTDGNDFAGFPVDNSYDYVILDFKKDTKCDASNSTLNALDAASPVPFAGGIANNVINTTVCSDSCEGVSAILGWLVCPILSGIDSFLIKYGDGFFVHELLSVDFSDDGGLDGDIGDGIGGQESINEIRAMWVQIRNITTALFVLFFLVAIMGQAVGMIEPYTAKKLIPRIAIAAVLTQLSYFIATEVSSIVDDIGLGIGDLIGNATDSDIGFADLFVEGFSAGDQRGSGAAVGFGFLAGAAGIAYGIFVILPFAISAFMALFTAFITLIIRRIILVGLVVLSPVALATWALPNTEKWAKRWWEWYTKILLAYPLIVVMLAVGKVMAKVLVGGNGNVDGLEEWVLVLGGVIAYFAPYLMMPYAIKLASSTFQNITGIVNDRSKGLGDRAKNWSREQQKGRQASSRRNALADYEETGKLGEGRGFGNAVKRGWARARSGYAAPTRHNNSNIDDAAEGAREERLKSSKIDRERRDADIRESEAKRNRSNQERLINNTMRTRDADYFDDEIGFDPSNKVQVAERDLRDANANGDSEAIRKAMSALIAALEDVSVDGRSVNGYGEWDEGVSPKELDEINKIATQNALRQNRRPPEPITAESLKGMSDAQKESLGIAAKMESTDQLKIQSPDKGLIDDKVKIVMAEIGDAIETSLGEMVVTAEDQIAAYGSMQKLHGNDERAVAAMRQFVNNGRASDSAAAQRAVKRAVDENIGSMNAATPHILLGTSGALDGGFQKTIAWNSGTTADITMNAAVGELHRIAEHLTQAEVSSQRGAVQSGNVKVILDKLENRRDQGTLTQEQFDAVSGQILQRYNRDGTFIRDDTSQRI